MSVVRHTGAAEFGEAWTQVLPEVEPLYALTGIPIQWLGYAPKGQESLEWDGVYYGFKGISMLNYGEGTLLTLYGPGTTFAKRPIVGRIEVREYPPAQEYLLFVTTLEPYGLADGSRYDYHIPADPRGGACMFRVSAADFQQMWRMPNE